MLGVPFLILEGYLCWCFEILWVRFSDMPGSDLTRNGTDVHLKQHSSLFSCKSTYLHLCSTFSSVSLWSLPSVSYPTAKMMSAIANTFGKSLNISSIFLWNICPVGAVPNGNLLYLCQLNWHANVVRYGHILSTFRL